ncbi:MAG: beta-ketoacyl-[acyl-carrier-protein] synthase family protein [Desulfovibrio sp.]|jgi:3-oxoacyl-[acyl-carrier-protein] synthase II|nr:beta-ketoacyl-[acyl-carrier-protein] synthase family protein [Desulfovibrio sp.]
MRLKRVVITGMGAVSPYGRGRELLFSSLLAGKSCIKRIPALEDMEGVLTRVGGVVPEIGISGIPRKIRRSMSPMSAYAYLAALEAMEQAGAGEELAHSGRLGIALGSTLGSPETLEEFFRSYLCGGGMGQMKSMFFFRSMGHSAAANTAGALGLRGRVIAPAAACASGTQAIGLAFEAVAFGRQDYMLCGGCDEYHPLVSCTFDLMAAASSAFNGEPELCPRPFDRRRDGVVCAEGAGVLFIESDTSARERGAPVLAEILGFACAGDEGGIAEPTPESIAACMRLALADAGVGAEDVSYVNAHATGTELGDIAEARAVAAVFGGKTPVSSLKGHLGHTMAACGALETIAVVEMLRRKTILPTRNLEEPDARCAGVFLPQKPIESRGDLAVKNSFALGGVNCSLVLRSGA